MKFSVDDSPCPQIEGDIIKKRHVLIIIFIALIGLSLLLYPAVSQRVNDNYQSTVCAEYSDAVEELDDETAEEELRKADEYNEDLTESVELLENPFMQSDAVDNGNYGNILNATAEGVMAYLEIPEINVMLPIYHGVGETELKKASDICRRQVCPWAEKAPTVFWQVIQA